MKIFISNLSFQTTSEDIKVLFDQYGEVASAVVVMDNDTGRSKGFGFVEMNDENEGNEAINSANNTELNGRDMRVSRAS